MSEKQSLKSIDDIPGTFDWSDLTTEQQTARMIRMSTHPFEFFDELYQNAKSVDPEATMSKISVAGTNSIVLFSHDLMKQWQEYELRGKTQRNSFDHIVNLFGMFMNMYGKDHTNWRKTTVSGFKPKIIDQYTDFIQSCTSNIVLDGVYDECQKTNEYIQLYQNAKTFAFEVGSKFTMGPLLDENDRSETYRVFQEFLKGITPEAFSDLQYEHPDSVASKSLESRDELIELLTPFFRKAKDLVNKGEWENVFGSDNECLIKALLENSGFDYGGKEMEEREAVQLLIVLVFAAYDTTATTMNNLVYAMNKHPEETNKLREYIQSDPLLSNPKTKLDLNLLSNCVPLNCFIDEGNRLYGIIPMSTRQVRAEEGLDFGGYLLPKDTFLTIPVRWLHQGENSWTDPFEFIPERHNTMNGDKVERGDIGRYNNIPFMTGLHKCLGIHLAKHELRMYTVLLLRDWDFELDEDKFKDSVNNGINLEGFPHYDVWIKMKKLQQQ